ncbi:MAG: hypothetical protein ACXV8R_05300 [Acidimicrobiia bacterium]
MRLVSKFAVFASTAALTVAVVAPGTASAAGPVYASGTLHCAISGKVRIAPKLLSGSTAVGGALFLAKVKGTGCTGSSGVTSVKGNLMARLPSTDCLGLSSGSFPAATLGPIKYTGPGAKFYVSTANFTAGGTFTMTDPLSLSLPGTGSSLILSRSFAGQQPTITLVVDQTVADFATACGPKVKGVKGSGTGLKKVTFGTTSSFDIG